MSRFLSRKEVADKLGISLPSLDRLIARSDFPAIRLGRSVKIPEDKLDEWTTNNIGKMV